jgi:putative hydrolase of the HAD superfamily
MMLRYSLNSQRRKIIFDLDDTLYSEKDYVISALSFAGNLIQRLFNITEAAHILLNSYNEGIQDPISALYDTEMLPGHTKSEIVMAMRAHIPNICLSPSASIILDYLRSNSMGFGIITDGRSLTQRAKMAALGCLDADFVSISEEVQIPKTDTARFLQVEAKFPSQIYCYIGDNPAKDFIAPNKLGWETVMLLNNGKNIHSQSITDKSDYTAKIKINTLCELIGTIL